MAVWRSFVDARKGFPATSGIPQIACFLAAILLVAGASHVSVHEHDHQDAELDKECLVCSVSSFDGAKVAPEETTAAEPIDATAGILKFFLVVGVGARDSLANPVRGPPVSVSSPG